MLKALKGFTHTGWILVYALWSSAGLFCYLFAWRPLLCCVPQLLEGNLAPSPAAQSGWHIHCPGSHTLAHPMGKGCKTLVSLFLSLQPSIKYWKIFIFLMPMCWPTGGVITSIWISHGQIRFQNQFADIMRMMLTIVSF